MQTGQDDRDKLLKEASERLTAPGIVNAIVIAIDGSKDFSITAIGFDTMAHLLGYIELAKAKIQHDDMHLKMAKDRSGKGGRA